MAIRQHEGPKEQTQEVAIPTFLGNHCGAPGKCGGGRNPRRSLLGGPLASTVMTNQHKESFLRTPSMLLQLIMFVAQAWDLCAQCRCLR